MPHKFTLERGPQTRVKFLFFFPHGMILHWLTAKLQKVLYLAQKFMQNTIPPPPDLSARSN